MRWIELRSMWNKNLFRILDAKEITRSSANPEKRTPRRVTDIASPICSRWTFSPRPSRSSAPSAINLVLTLR